MVAWYSDPLGPRDSDTLRTPLGSSKGQQVREALNLLVALRLWAHRWHSHRVTFEVRADNIAALTLVTTMRGKGWALNVIARELALDYARAAFRPAVCARVPGVGLATADALSRRFQPEQGSSSLLPLQAQRHGWAIPAVLPQAAEEHPPPRPASYYRSLGPITGPTPTTREAQA